MQQQFLGLGVLLAGWVLGVLAVVLAAGSPRPRRGTMAIGGAVPLALGLVAYGKPETHLPFLVPLVAGLVGGALLFLRHARVRGRRVLVFGSGNEVGLTFAAAASLVGAVASVPAAAWHAGVVQAMAAMAVTIPGLVVLGVVRRSSCAGGVAALAVFALGALQLSLYPGGDWTISAVRIATLGLAGLLVLAGALLTRSPWPALGTPALWCGIVFGAASLLPFGDLGSSWSTGLLVAHSGLVVLAASTGRARALREMAGWSAGLATVGIGAWSLPLATVVWLCPLCAFVPAIFAWRQRGAVRSVALGFACGLLTWTGLVILALRSIDCPPFEADLNVRPQVFQWLGILLALPLPVALVCPWNVGAADVRRALPRALGRLAAAVFLFPAILLVALGVGMGSLERERTRLHQLESAAGRPVLVEDLPEFAPVPHDRNAAMVLHPVWRWLNDEYLPTLPDDYFSTGIRYRASLVSWADIRRPADADWLKEARGVLAELEPLYDHLDRALACDVYDFEAVAEHIDNDGNGIPGLMNWSHAHHALALRAKVRAVAGDPVDGVADLARMLRFSRLIAERSESLFIIQIEGSLLGIFERALAHNLHRLDVASLRTNVLPAVERLADPDFLLAWIVRGRAHERRWMWEDVDGLDQPTRLGGVLWRCRPLLVAKEISMLRESRRVLVDWGAPGRAPGSHDSIAFGWPLEQLGWVGWHGLYRVYREQLEERRQLVRVVELMLELQEYRELEGRYPTAADLEAAGRSELLLFWEKEPPLEIVPQAAGGIQLRDNSSSFENSLDLRIGEQDPPRPRGRRRGR